MTLRYNPQFKGQWYLLATEKDENGSRISDPVRIYADEKGFTSDEKSELGLEQARRVTRAGGLSGQQSSSIEDFPA